MPNLATGTSVDGKFLALDSNGKIIRGTLPTPPTVPIQGISDTPSVDLTVTGTTLKADVRVAAFSDNLIEVLPEGLYANFTIADQQACLQTSGSGTEVSPYQVALNNEAASTLIGVTQFTGPGALGSANILSGSGWVNYQELSTNLINRAFAQISCPVSATIGTYNYAVVYIGTTGIVAYQNGPLTQAQLNSGVIQLFTYTSTNGTTVTGTNLDTKWAGYNPDTLMRDLFNQIGNPKKGLALSAGAAAAQLGISSGKFIGMGINATTGESRIAKSVSATTMATFFMSTSTVIDVATPLTEINNVYINPTGNTRTLMANNKWSNIRVYAVYDATAPNGTIVVLQWGPAEYSSKSDAIAAVNSEAFTINPSNAQLTYLGVITMEKGGLSVNANFSSTGKWGDGAGAGGSGGTSIAGNNQSAVKVVSGAIVADNEQFIVSTEAELMAALSAPSQGILQRSIQCACRINITTNNTAIAVRNFDVVYITGGPIYFSGVGKINCNFPASVFHLLNEVYFDAAITNPFGTATTGNHNVKFTQLKGTSVVAVTFTPATGCLYEKLSVCTTNATQNYWNNTFVLSGNPTAPISLNWISFGKSACSASFSSNSPCGAIIDPSISGLVTQLSLLVSSNGGGLVTLFVYDMTTVYQTGNSAPVLAKITFNVTRQGEVFIALDGVTAHNGVNNVTITRSTGFDWTLNKAKTYGVCLQDNGSSNWLGINSANTGYPTAPSIPTTSALNTSAVVSSQINAIYARMKN